MFVGHTERFYSVDVETSGPIPGEYSMLSLGACLIDSEDSSSLQIQQSFSCIFKPISPKFDPKALEISGFSLEQLEQEGDAPADAMNNFAAWISSTAQEAHPVFVGFNAAFDWSFVNYYFHRFLGSNPFGFAALDIKSLYMGAATTSWHDTRSSAISKVLNPKHKGNHNALDDALAQAELFLLTLDLGRKS